MIPEPGDYRPYPNMPTYDELLGQISRMMGELDLAKTRLHVARTYLARTPAAAIVNRRVIEGIS